MAEKNAVGPAIGQLDSDQLEQLMLANIIPQGTPKEQVQIFATVCQEKSLSPFQKQIYLLPFKKSKGQAPNKTWETHYACIVGIDGYRTIAERTGKYAGNDDYRFDNGKTEFECRNADQKNPVTATATVYKIMNGQRVPYSATVSWESYYPAQAGKAFNWNRMPYLMLGKTAEALALRKAFPEALSGLHSEDEMGGFEETKDPQEVAALEKSAAACQAAKVKVDKYTDADKLKAGSEKIVKDAVSAGLNSSDTQPLTEYINQHYLSIKPDDK